MKRTRHSVVAAFFLAMILFPAATWAAKAYVSDPKETPLRAGPGMNYKVLATLPSGSGLEVLKTAEWIQVRFSGPGGEIKEGWVQNSAVAAYPPESSFIKELQAENAQIHEKLVSLERERADLAQREKDLTEKLKKAETAYESLKSGATNYVKLKEEYDGVKVGADLGRRKHAGTHPGKRGPEVLGTHQMVHRRGDCAALRMAPGLVDLTQSEEAPVAIHLLTPGRGPSTLLWAKNSSVQGAY